MHGVNKPCQDNPTRLARILMWAGFDRGAHQWREYRKLYRHTVYYCRVCSRCGAEQVQSAGPRGDGKWHDVSAPWGQQWEKEQFENAEVITVDHAHRDIRPL